LLKQLKSTKEQLISEKKIMDKKDKHIYPISETPFSIPNNWTWCYLSDISIIQEGPGIRKHQYNNEGVQFLTVTNIIEGFVDLDKSKKYISIDEYKERYSHFTINKGDIVTACSGGSWGKSAIFNYDDKIILNTSTLRLRFFNDLGDNRYLYYLTKTDYFKKSLSSYSTGQQPNYGYYHYSRIPIPLPPLSAQRRIVEILDKSLATIDTARAIAEKNLQNSLELFDSYLNKVFTNPREDWKEKKLVDVCTLQRGFDLPKRLRENGRFPLASSSGIIDTHCEYKVKGPGVVTGRSGSIGNVFHIAKDFWPLNTTLYVKDFHGNESMFIYHLLKQFGLNKYASGAGVPTLNRNNVHHELIKIPISIDEQKEIVKDVEDLSTYIKNLENNYNQKLRDLDELKRSILQKAFDGKL